MGDLSGAVAKTMNFVFSDIESTTNENKKRIEALKANIGKVVNISIDEIETNENVRKSVDTKSESFLRLVESVKRYGILENVVAELKIDQENNYRLVCVAGHRRILAAKEAGNVIKIPCLLQSYTEKGDNIGAALAENLNREDLHCLDVAEGYKGLIDSGWTLEELANHFCRDIRTIKHYIKMAGWSQDVKSLLRENPEQFSTRVIMRQYAYKRFSDGELKEAIKKYMAPSAKKVKKQAVNENTAVDRKAMKQALSAYLLKQKFLSEVIKDEIKRAFSELKLI